MSWADRQADVERNVFSAFTDVSSLPIRSDSIENRKPPEPDILCDVVGEGLVAFEMVELVEQPVAMGYNSAFKFKQLMRDAYEALDDPKKTIMDERIGNALISVTFSDGAYVPVWKLSMPHLFSLFESLDPTFSGIVPLPDNSPLHGMVRRVYIARLDSFAKPIFNLDFGGSFGDPSEERICGKFGKSYRTNHPIELLGYYLYQPPFPEDSWLLKLRSAVEHEMSSSPFRRVWIFDYATKDVWQI